MSTKQSKGGGARKYGRKKRKPAQQRYVARNSGRKKDARGTKTTS